jgi:hypothetical protein
VGGLLGGMLDVGASCLGGGLGVEHAGACSKSSRHGWVTQGAAGTSNHS